LITLSSEVSNGIEKPLAGVAVAFIGMRLRVYIKLELIALAFRRQVPAGEASTSLAMGLTMGWTMAARN
jgi:hypothetical protein